jgi:DNA-binding transcriptional MocR family regulator
VVAPAGLASGIAAMLRVDCWSAPAQTALIVTRLIEEGRLDTIIAEQRDELARRHAVLAGFLGPDELDGAPGVPQAWLKLPPPLARRSLRQGGPAGRRRAAAGRGLFGGRNRPGPQSGAAQPCRLRARSSASIGRPASCAG